MLVFEEEGEVFGYKVQSPLRGYLGEGVREFLDLSLQDIQNLVKESPEVGVVFSLVVHLLNLFLGLSQRYGFPGVLPNITNLQRPPPALCQKVFRISLSSGGSLGVWSPRSSVRRFGGHTPNIPR